MNVPKQHQRDNPAIHHRRSIRLKGHDYAGGGVYFVTICAHREFIQFAHGRPFGALLVGARPASPRPAPPSSPERATQVSPVRNLIEERMRITAEKCPFMRWDEAVIMPDHLHALIRMEGGHQRLGDVIGGFKAAVSRELHRRGDTCVALRVPDNVRIWHRNYYESIVCTADAARRIAEYIRMNPWRCVQEFGNGLRGIGNPALLNREKIGMLCSRNCPPETLHAATQRAKSAGAHCCFLGGFHSPSERALLAALLQSEARLICCPAWGIDTMRIPAAWLPALEANRMLILEMPRTGEAGLAPTRAAAEQRNRFVLENADERWIPHITPGGMLDRLVRATPVSPPVSPRQAPSPGHTGDTRVALSSPPITPHPNLKKPS